MCTILEEISKIGIVPVIAINDAEQAIPLAKALIGGGIPCAEVTFRTAQGAEAIRRIASAGLDIILGAGTVLTTAQVDSAIDAGAKFIVSPGFNSKVVEYCVKKGILIIPGCSSPSDIEQAIEFGLKVVKFFPAEQAGGLEYIKAIAAPYSGIKFMPTGGINAANLVKYLAFEKIVACGGSWMVRKDLLESGNYDEITRLSGEAVRSMLGFEVLHVGINGTSKDEAVKAAGIFNNLFGFQVKDGNSSSFAGSGIELTYSPVMGQHGHIAVGTYSVSRAVAFLERMGFEFDYSTAREKNSRLNSIYLKNEIAGFGVHLLQK